MGGSFTGFFFVAALFLEGGDVGEEEFADVGDAEGGAFFQRVLGDGGVELVEEVEVAVEAFGDQLPKAAVEHGLEFFLGGGAGGLGADPFQVGGGDGVVAIGIGDGGGVEAGAGRKAVGEAVAVGGFLGEFAAEAVEFAGAEVGTVEEDLDFEEFLTLGGIGGFFLETGELGLADGVGGFKRRQEEKAEAEAEDGVQGPQRFTLGGESASGECGKGEKIEPHVPQPRATLCVARERKGRGWGSGGDLGCFLRKPDRTEPAHPL